MIEKINTNMIQKKIQNVFATAPEVLYGFTDISYSIFSNEYQSALVFAVPYEPQLTLKNYSEKGFENSILKAKRKLEAILSSIENVLQKNDLKYYIPSVAQKSEEDLLAEFSFKFAAVNAGLGWIGKNYVLITPEYGPRVRLSAILIDHFFTYGKKITQSKCPKACTKCIDICPHKLLTGTDWNIDSKRSDLIDYHMCNKKRSAYIKDHGRKNSCGLCLVVCPFGTSAL